MATTEKRACANCCAYYNDECMNGLGYTQPTDVCESHKTWAEDRAEDEAINRFRASLGLPPLRPIE